MEWRAAENVAKALTDNGLDVTINVPSAESAAVTVTFALWEVTVGKLREVLGLLNDSYEAEVRIEDGQLRFTLT